MAILCTVLKIIPSFEDAIQMVNCEWGCDLSTKGPVKIIRIEKTSYQELLGISGYLGKVGQIYQNGFDLIREDRRLIHFRGGEWLHTPFGAILDRPIGRWVKEVSLQEGDIFSRQGQLLVRKPRNGCSIRLNPTNIIDLKRTLCSSPPGGETLRAFVQLLTEKILKLGKFEGMAGTLNLLKKELPDIFLECSFPISFWSRHALPRVSKLIQSSINEDFRTFEEAWEPLLGLGPGLTPASDDFLVGFLAAHKLFSSSFGKGLEDEELKRKLREKASIKTVPIAFQFLSYALEGVFSETLYLAFNDLFPQNQQKCQEVHLHPEKEGTETIGCYLKWGHSSGTDTLTGTVFGLWTMI